MQDFLSGLESSENRTIAYAVLHCRAAFTNLKAAYQRSAEQHSPAEDPHLSYNAAVGAVQVRLVKEVNSGIFSIRLLIPGAFVVRGTEYWEPNAESMIEGEIIGMMHGEPSKQCARQM